MSADQAAKAAADKWHKYVTAYQESEDRTQVGWWLPGRFRAEYESWHFVRLGNDPMGRELVYILKHQGYQDARKLIPGIKFLGCERDRLEDTDYLCAPAEVHQRRKMMKQDTMRKADVQNEGRFRAGLDGLGEVQVSHEKRST